MRTASITLTLALVIGLIATTAFAWGPHMGYGGMGYNGMGYGTAGGYNCPGFYGTSVNSAEYRDFLDSTEALRETLAADQAELDAVLAAPAPDSARIRALTARIVDTRNELATAARENGLDTYGHVPGRHMYDRSGNSGHMYGNGHMMGW